MSISRASRRSALVLATLAAIAVGGLWVLLRGGTGATDSVETDRSVRTDDAEVAPVAVDGALDLADDAAPARERAAATGLADPAVSAASSALPCSLVIAVQPTPWIDEEDAGVAFEWTPDDGRTRNEETGIRRDRPLDLDGVPRSATEFGRVRVADLEAEVIKLTETEPGSASADRRIFELEVALVPGATAVWDDSVPAERRVPVTLSLGGSVSPPSREVWRHGRRSGLVERLESIELPVQLPRLAREESLWVGGAGLAWKAFAVDPSSTRIEVWTEAGVSIRVEHDLDPSRGDLHAWAMEFPSGDAEKSAVDRRDTLTLGPRRAGTLEVWISSGGEHDSPRVTRTARFDASAGERVDVDLTRAYARKNLGSVRVELRSVHEVSGVPRADVALRIETSAPAGSEYPWARAGEFETLTDEATDGWVYGVEGLEPGEYRATVAPFALVVPLQVEAGDQLERVVSLDGVGWIDVDPPEGHGGNVHQLMLTSVAPDPRQRSIHWLGNGRQREGRTMWPVVPGRYTASIPSFGEGEAVLSSAPFDVVAGQVVRVPLVEREQWSVRVRAKDVDSGDPIALDLEFWVDLRAVDTTTERPLLMTTEFEGGADVYVGCRLQFDATGNPVRIELPDHPHWAFATLDPLTLRDGLTIEMLGRRKSR